MVVKTVLRDLVDSIEVHDEGMSAPDSASPKRFEYAPACSPTVASCEHPCAGEEPPIVLTPPNTLLRAGDGDC